MVLYGLCAMVKLQGMNGMNGTPGHLSHHGHCTQCTHAFVMVHGVVHGLASSWGHIWLGIFRRVGPWVEGKIYGKASC